METKYKEITTLKLLLIYTFFARKNLTKGFFKHPANHKISNPKKETTAGTMCFSILGRGSKGGGIVVGEHVQGKAGFRVCDVLA